MPETSRFDQWKKRGITWRKFNHAYTPGVCRRKIERLHDEREPAQRLFSGFVGQRIVKLPADGIISPPIYS
jgi:hypothetical protein